MIKLQAPMDCLTPKSDLSRA